VLLGLIAARVAAACALLLASPTTADVFSPAATITGTFALSDGELPRELTARVQINGASAEITCPIEKRVWRCRVPAAQFDLRLQLPEYAPIYLWRQQPPSGGVLNAGEQRLERGGSIAGWIESPRGMKLADAEAALRVRSLGGTGESSLMTAMTTKADSRGFFQFRGVPRGAYAISAHAGDAASSATIEVDVDGVREAELRDPIRLVPPIALDVRISPHVAPGARPWKVVLQRPVPGSNFRAPVTESAAGDDGSWRYRAPVGDYVLLIAEQSGSVHHREELHVDESTPPISIALSLVEVAGRVKAGTRPLKAKLTFSMKDGTAVGLESDADGQFSGVLPRAGKWNVRVRLVDERMYFTAVPVEIRQPENGEAANADVTLPGGAVRGKVSDEAGKGVEADVQLFRDGRVIAVTASAHSGEFSLYGLADGAAAIHAEADDAESALVPVQVSEASDAIVNLVAARSRRLRGFATTRSGSPVTGALIRCVAPTFLEQRETTTGSSGEFTIAIPPQTPALDCVVLAGGLPATITRMPVASTSSPIQLVIDETFGTLKIPLAAGIRPYVGHDGAVVSLSALFQPRVTGPPPGFTSGGYEARVAAGAYDVCPERVPSDGCRHVLVAPMSYVTADITSHAEKRP